MIRFRRIVPAVALVLAWAAASRAYIETPHSLGQICQLSTIITLVRVAEADKGRIVLHKVRDLKGKSPDTLFKQDCTRGGFQPRERQIPLAWAERDKAAVIFQNGSISLTCIGAYWYRCDPTDGGWALTQGEPYLLRAYHGSADRLAAAVTEIVAGREVIVPCLADDNKEAMQQGKGKVQRLRASLKLLTYDPKRDFAGWESGDATPADKK